MLNGASGPFNEVDPGDLEMRAYYVESAYKAKVDSMITYLQPYVRFQSWDKGYNINGDNEYQFVDFGINAGLSGYDAFLRAEYQTRINEPGDSIDEEDKLILRLQINL